MNTDTLASNIETILFLSGDPISIVELEHLLETDEATIGTAINQLHERYQASASGLSLVGHNGEIRLTTRPENSEIAERFLRAEREGPLSRASLETLSIIAYRGPTSRADIDAIRGVNSAITVRTLLMRGLIERKGNPHDARGYLYTVSFPFLETLGLSDISELPNYESLSQDPRLQQVAEPSTKEPSESASDDQSS